MIFDLTERRQRIGFIGATPPVDVVAQPGASAFVQADRTALLYWILIITLVIIFVLLVLICLCVRGGKGSCKCC